MSKSSYFCGGSILAVALTMGLAGTAAAQEAATVEEVVVTGSFIAGTPEDAALPVDVIGSRELANRGAPTMVQLIKTIPSSGAVIGENNRFGSGSGAATINLRNLNSAVTGSRTLVLFNGRRLPTSPQAISSVDINLLPTAAIGRVEVLKDGAAATYGSDAIGGVVNFITRRDLNGFEVDGEYALIDGSNGDYKGNVAWGKKFENGNILLTAGYRHRSRLDIHDRGYALRPFDFAGSSGAAGFTGASNPGFYVAGATAFRDNGCEELGGTLTRSYTFVNPLAGQPNQGATVGFAVPTGALNPATSGTGTGCRYQFANFNDLVNREDHYQLYGEVNFDLSENLAFHAEVAWTKNDTPTQRISPSNLTAQYPSPVSVGGTSFSPTAATGANLSVPFNVPVNNPGLLALINDCRAPLTATECASIRVGAFSTAGAQAGAPGGARGVDIVQLGWRALSFGGNPKFKDGADHQSIVNDGYRISGGLKGKIFGGVKFDTALTYMEQKNTSNTSDILVKNLQLALRGYGSKDGAADQCTAAETNNFTTGAGNAALGCNFFNPFTSGVQTSLVNGAANPFFNPTVANDPAVVAGLFGNYTNVLTNQILVADVVFSGETPLALPGGNVAWAAGGQYRYARELRKYGAFFNADENPCPDRAACADETGPLQFFGSATDRDDDANVKAIFAEVQAPLLDNLNFNFAIRYEDYQGGIGSTTNPKVAVKWQATDWLAFRGSASTTFRAPGSGLTGTGCNNGVRVLGSAYRAFQSCGNPNLKPEKADTFNVGVIFEYEGFSATLDYFNFKFKDEILEESGSRLYATMFPNGTNVNCGAAAFAELQNRFTFAGACGAANVARLKSFVINGPNTKTSGLEFRAQYDWDDFLVDGSNWTVGAEATYLIQYKRGAVPLLGSSTINIAPAEDRAGLSDILNDFFSYPELKANTFASYSKGDLSIRWQMRYSEGTSPAFGSPFFVTVPDASATQTGSATSPCTTSCAGRRLEAVGKSNDYFQHDLIVRWQAPWDTVITASVQNLFDKDPPYVPSPFNYDLTQGNPLGRVFEVGFKKSF